MTTLTIQEQLFANVLQNSYPKKLRKFHMETMVMASVVCWLGYWEIRSKKSHEKSAIITKILNYSNSSCTIFCAKISQYSHYAYYLQRELKHCGLRESRYFGLEVSRQFGIENQTKNQQYLRRFFDLYQLFMSNFLCQTVLISSFYILPKLLTT